MILYVELSLIYCNQDFFFFLLIDPVLLGLFYKNLFHSIINRPCVAGAVVQ